jgi:regulator of cell morphogenesis and NO signaling
MEDTLELSQQKVAEIVKANPDAMSVLDKFGIDFCCGGKLSLAKACDKAHVTLADVEQALVENAILASQIPAAEDPWTWTLRRLADHIVAKHHAYVEMQIPEILRLLDKVAHRHGDHHPELHDIGEAFHAVANELTQHMKKEELILFPWIKRYEEVQLGHLPYVQPPFGTIANPIQTMEAEHEQAGGGFATIRVLSKNYTLPEGACMSYWQTYHLLQEFEKDLHVHVHLENNILFPKALAIEEVISKASLS